MGKHRPSSSTQGSAPRIERKIIEKNRRNRLKTLYSTLISFLPDYTSKVEGLPLPDQIDKAVEHIKSMTEKLEKLRKKKELLLQQGKGPNAGNESKRSSSSSPPVIEVHDMGKNLSVVSASGVQDYSTFHQIIRLVHENGVEVAGASFAREGNAIIQLLRDNKVGQEKLGLEGATISKKLKEIVSGTCSSSEIVESEFNLWDYGIESDIWGFEIPKMLAAENDFGYCGQFLNMGNSLDI